VRRWGAWLGAVAIFLQTFVSAAYGPAAIAAQAGSASNLSFAICGQHSTLAAPHAGNEADGARHAPASSVPHTCPICFSLTPAGSAIEAVAFAEIEPHPQETRPHDVTSTRLQNSGPGFGKLARAPPRIL
jgi:hypothetical protein